MTTKKSHEGYLLVDHRNSPGLPEQMAISSGAHRGLFEAATYTCSHCQTVVVINPLRTRDREWCAKCNHYICDRCAAIKAATNECKTFEQIIDEAHAINPQA